MVRGEICDHNAVRAEGVIPVLYSWWNDRHLSAADPPVCFRTGQRDLPRAGSSTWQYAW